VEFSEVLRRRRMVRAYDPDRPIPPNVRDRLIHAALRAPSAGFTQGCGFLVLEAARDRDAFWRATSAQAVRRGRWARGMRQAPLLIVCFSNRKAYADRYAQPDKDEDDLDGRWPVPYWHIDAGFAALLVLLAAVDEELGACFFGVPPSRVAALREAFGVPDAFTPVGVVSAGYPAPDHRPRSLSRGRRPTEEVVHVGRWNCA
jgi:nitroreductase